MYTPYGINAIGFPRPEPNRAQMLVGLHPAGYPSPLRPTLNLGEPPQSVHGMRQRQDPVNREYGRVVLLPKNFDQFNVDRRPKDVKILVKNNYGTAVQIPDQRAILPVGDI